MAKKKGKNTAPAIRRPASANDAPTLQAKISTFAALTSMKKLVLEVESLGVVGLPKTVGSGIDKAAAKARKLMKFGG